MIRSKLIIIFFFLTITSFSQPTGNLSTGTVSGFVFDALSGEPIEYANIVLFSTNDSLMRGGTITDKTGRFSLTGIRTGSYYLDVRFIGYEDERFEFEITSSANEVNLNNIKISPTAINLENVVVEGDRSPVTYHIDKKVVDVSKMQTVISGNAADVLENVPSVTVDIEGNVSLRGSSNFTVLIDGRPSVMNGQDVLQQIPASSIEKIEIITNPSAKYDPDGTAGIINILLKKNQNVGMSGILNTNVGLNDKYGGDFLFENRSETITTTFGVDFNKRIFPGSSREENRFITSSSTSFLNSSGSAEWGRIAYGLRGGLELKFSENDFVGLGIRYGSRDGKRNSNLNFQEWSLANPQHSYFTSNSERERNGDFYSANFSYIKNLGVKGHELKTEFNFGYDESDEFTLTREIENNIQTGGRRTREFGPSKEFEGKIDYTLPFSEKNKFEAGYDGEIEISDEGNDLSEFNPQTGIFELLDQFSNRTRYNESGHSIYSIYSDEFSPLGIQAGVRGEYTYRTIELLKQSQEFKIDRWDFFPTLHASYKFSEGTQLMASYTRRIERARGWQLEPFLTWMDANNVRIGNPALQPEFIDSYETGIQSFIGKVSVSAEVYYRKTNNKVENVRSVYQQNVTLNSVQNIGSDYAIGSEFMIIADPFDFWNLNIMANVYNYKVEGVLNSQAFSRNSNNWNGRINNVFRLGTATSMQFNVNYNSPTVSSQGRSEGFFSSDAAVKHDLFNRKLSLTLQVRDIFGTAKHEFTSQGPDFYNYNYFERESPFVMLSIRWNFNNYKPKRDQIEQEGFSPGEEF
ncbi:MAG: TonB-dependent receptor [Ignavibacteriales bacterium]|nr:MAG: TonB-dependent receptor [Ignavibacteriales bacterium]